MYSLSVVQPTSVFSKWRTMRLRWSSTRKPLKYMSRSVWSSVKNLCSFVLVTLHAEWHIVSVQIGTYAMDTTLLKYGAKDYFFKAALCHFCVDMLNCKVRCNFACSQSEEDIYNVTVIYHYLTLVLFNSWLYRSMKNCSQPSLMLESADFLRWVFLPTHLVAYIFFYRLELILDYGSTSVEVEDLPKSLPLSIRFPLSLLIVLYIFFIYTHYH